MRTNPLATVCIFFCLGIWAAKYVLVYKVCSIYHCENCTRIISEGNFLDIPLFFIYVSCVLFLLGALFSLKKQSLFFLSLSLAIFLTGFLHLTNSQTYPANHISKFISDKPQKVYVLGKVVTNPEVSQTFYHSKKTTFTFRTDDLRIGKSWQTVEGLVKVTLYGERKDREGKIRVAYGDELVLQGSLVRPPGLRNPGGFNYREYLANHNIFGLLKVKEKDALKVMSPGPSLRANAVSEAISKEEIASSPSVPRNDGILKAIFAFKQKLHQIIYHHLEPQQAALLSAILLGERSRLSQDVKDIFINTGTIHIFAISGLHVGLIALILIALFRFMRLPRRLTFIFTIFLLISYAALSGARPSVVRATIMAVTVLLGLLINREVRIYNSLGLAALIILLFHPHYLFDSGFQLSFLSVISIVYFTPKIEKTFPARLVSQQAGGSTHNRFFFYLIRAFSVSLAAWIGIAPLTAYYFNIVTPVAVLANLVVIPLLFLVVSVGICFLIFAYLWVPLGAIFAQTCSLSLFGLTKLASLISQIPLGLFHSPRPGIFFLCSYYALVLLIFNYKKLKLSSGKAMVILLLAANFLVWKPLFETYSDKLTVTFLDVGLGDAIFVEFPGGGTMLIDGGSGHEFDAGRWVILPFLWNRGIRKIDAVVLTHSDNDHVGGLASVLKDIKVNYVFDNGLPKDSISYKNYRVQVAKNVSHYQVLKRGEKILGIPRVNLFVVHPPSPLLSGTSADANNNSVVLRLVYKDVSFLFCADIQKDAMEQLLPLSPMLKSTIIKVPHHGSDEGKTEGYLFQAISPKFAVISVDRNNRFGFSAPEVVERLKKLGTEVYKTSDSGAVIISTDGKGVWIETMVDAEAGI